MWSTSNDKKGVLAMKKISFKNREEFTYYLFLYLKNDDESRFRTEFLEIHPTDQVEIFKLMSDEKRKKVYHILKPDEFAEIFKRLNFPEQRTVFSELEDDYALSMIKELPADELTDFFSEIPDPIATYLLGKLDKEDSENIKLLLTYKANTAGALMTTEFVTVTPEETVATVLDVLRREGNEAETIYYIYVVDEGDKLVGIVSLREIITAPLEEVIKNVMKEQVITVSALANQQEVSAIIKDYDLLAVPVITTEGKMVGIVTVDDIIDVMEKEVTEDIGELAAAKGAVNLEISAITATQKRLPWLLVLLVIGMLTASLISSFEATLTEIALLAIFIPLIADMAGNTGTQSLAVVVRSLALENLDRFAIAKLIKREAATGWMMGIVCGLVVSMIAYFIPNGSILFGFIIGVSLFITILVSTLTGTVIPLIVHKLNIDPAVASGPFITTINDIIGLFTYFSIATALLHYL